MSEPIRAVDRALDILLCFSRQTPQLSMTQIADLVGMNKSTVHRLLGTLEKKRFVHRDPTTGFYRLGIRFLQMAFLTLEQSDLRKFATPILKHLCEEHRETITLSVLDDTDVVFLDVIESSQRVKIAASTGQHLPAFATAAGQAMLAHLTEPTVQEILERGMQPFTSNTIQSVEVLLAKLTQIREQGFAMAEQEYEDGINAVAAAVLNPAGSPIAAITVAGPAYRLPAERMHKIGITVVAAANEVAQGFDAVEVSKNWSFIKTGQP